jgi:hypothetical protein
MARDWRKVALAVLTAATLASVCVLGSRVEAQQTAKSAKAPAKSSAPQAKKDDDDEEQGKAPAKKKRQDPVEAQRAIDAADKLLQGGKAEQAAQALTVTLAGGNLPPAIMARALYIRGTAYRQQSKPAQAISDLTSALWLKGGLSAEDRQAALKQRAGAYADAGLTESGEIAAAAAPATKEAKERTPTKSWGIVTTPTDNSASNTTKTAEGGSNWFKNWFNSAAPSAQANSAPPVTASIDKTEAPLPKAAQAPAAPRVASAWSSKTQVNAETVPAEVRAPSVPPARAEGKYRIQLAIVRTQQEAAALAAKAKRALAGALAHEPEIDQAVLGNMGSFFRVRVGPFATVQETQAVCAKVKGTGFDCLTVTQ